jgi:hypothetical protein
MKKLYGCLRVVQELTVSNVPAVNLALNQRSRAGRGASRYAELKRTSAHYWFVPVFPSPRRNGGLRLIHLGVPQYRISSTQIQQSDWTAFAFTWMASVATAMEAPKPRSRLGR